MALLGGDVKWRVLSRAADGGVLENPFSGDRAYARARELFELVKGEAGAVEVALMRLEGNQWVCIDRLRRDERGEWAETPFEPGATR